VEGVVTVRCRKCGARYETSLPAESVRRIARCPACRLRLLEVVEDRGVATRPQDEQRQNGRPPRA
jgi:DNA-directed RNA polymerase subunit RPC12/RpoP